MKNKYKLYRYVHYFVFFQSLKYIHYAVTTKCNTKWKPSIFSTWTMNTVMFYTGNGCLDWSGSSGYHFSFHFFQAYFWISMFLCTNDIVTIVLSKTKKENQFSSFWRQEWYLNILLWITPEDVFGTSHLPLCKLCNPRSVQCVHVSVQITLRPWP